MYTVDNLLLHFLGEAKDDAPETADPVDTPSDDSNKDLAANKTDVKSDSEDVKPDDASEKSDEAIKAPDDGTDAPADDEPSESELPADSDQNAVVANDSDANDKEKLKERSKRLFLYQSLIEMKELYISLSEVYSAIDDFGVHPANTETLNSIKAKIDFNIGKLGELLTNEVFATSGSVASLQSIYNIYVSDLRSIDTNLKLFARATNMTSSTKT